MIGSNDRRALDAFDRPDDPTEAGVERLDRFDLVLTDKNLPGASGLEVLRVARGLDPPPAVVLITGYSSYDSAVEALDICLGWIVGTIERVKGVAIITSDNGNCEQMTDPGAGGPHTAHTTNPVPFILCDPKFEGSLREGGSLEDIAPTMLELLGIEKSPEMTGRSLLLA